MRDKAIPDLSEPERLVLTHLRACPGLASAMPVDMVAAYTDIEPRKVQEIVKHLIEAHGFPIGSATGEPHGYYWITSAEEQEKSERQLEHRIISTARRLAKLRRNTPHAILLQLSLDLEVSVVGAHGGAPSPQEASHA